MSPMVRSLGMYVDNACVRDPFRGQTEKTVVMCDEYTIFLSPECEVLLIACP